MIHSIGLTGGIGSGKSTIAGILKQLGYPVYLADPEASRLINRSVEIRNDLTGLFGADLYTPRGMLDKKLLADIIFKNPQALSQVNGIVHPRVIFNTGGNSRTVLWSSSNRLFFLKPVSPVILILLFV